MNTGKNNLKSENDLDELIRGSFGFSDEQLLEDLRKAEQTIDDSQIPPSPEDGFQQILNKIEQQNIKSYKETHPSEMPVNISDEKKEKKHWIFSKRVRVLLTAAILLGVLMGANITVSGKRSYEYMHSERKGERNDVAFDNDENKFVTSELDNAYQKIHDEIGIQVLKMGNIPTNMKYEELSIDKKQAIICFTYQGKRIYFIQDLKTDSSSSNIISERKVIKVVYNGWLDRNIEVKSLELDGGEVEYSSEIKLDSAFYYISGVMELEEFVKIIEDLNFY